MMGMWRLAVYAAPVGPGTATAKVVATPAGAGAPLWWEAAPAAAASPGTPLLAATVDPAAQSPFFLRLDRVELDSGAATPLHFHRGPGLRVLDQGGVRVTIGTAVHDRAPGQAWFEPGNEPVLGRATAPGRSAFLRWSLLPGELRGGKSSFVPANDAEAGKPRGVAVTLIGEWDPVA